MKLTTKLVKDQWQIMKGKKIIGKSSSKKIAEESAKMWGRSPEELERDSKSMRKDYEKALKKVQLVIEGEFLTWEKNALERYKLVSKGKKVPEDMVRLYDRFSTLMTLLLISDGRFSKKQKR